MCYNDSHAYISPMGLGMFDILHVCDVIVYDMQICLRLGDNHGVVKWK